MEIEVSGVVPVTGDCGHKFNIPIGKADEEFTCPECGRKDRLSAEQVASVVQQVRDAVAELGANKATEAVNQTLKKFSRPGSRLKWKPRR